MDELIKNTLAPVYEAFKGMSSTMQLILVVVVLIITQGPKLLTLRARWYDYRLDRNRLQYEKERLETLKLHYEIEAIKNSNGFSTDAYENELRKGSHKSPLSIKYPHIPRLVLKIQTHINEKKLWRWVENFPRVGKFSLDLLYGWIAVNSYLTAFATVSIVFMSFTAEVFRSEFGTGGILFINLAYIVLTAIFFYWKELLAHQRKLLHEIKGGSDK